MPNSPIFTDLERMFDMVCRLQNVRNGEVLKKSGYSIKISFKRNEKAPDFSGADAAYDRFSIPSALFFKSEKSETMSFQLLC